LPNLEKGLKSLKLNSCRPKGILKRRKEILRVIITHMSYLIDFEMKTFFENNFKTRLFQKNAMMLMNACWFRIFKTRDVID
jgi:hypothetical protein